MGLTKNKLSAVEIKQFLRKDTELKRLFQSAVRQEAYEIERASEQGYFHAAPPGIDNFLGDVHETLMVEFAQILEGEREVTKEQFDSSLEQLETTIAEAYVLGWLSDGYSKRTDNASFVDFAYTYLPSYF